MKTPDTDAPEDDWVEYLSEVISENEFSADPFSPAYFNREHLDATAGLLHQCLKSRLGEVSMGGNIQDRTDFAQYHFEQRWIRQPDNRYPFVDLSQFENLVTAYLEWDFTSEALELIKSAVAEAGCHYVPFRIFANPDDFRWEVYHEWVQHAMKGPLAPIARNFQMKREELWSSLFDYL